METSLNDIVDETPELPASLKILRLMVFLLTGVMIVGFIVLVALFVTRLSGDDVMIPETITLPDGTSASAFTQGRDFWAVVIEGDAEGQQILIFDRATGALRQSVDIE